jgi:hypothetical protein
MVQFLGGWHIVSSTDTTSSESQIFADLFSLPISGAGGSSGTTGGKSDSSPIEIEIPGATKQEMESFLGLVYFGCVPALECQVCQPLDPGSLNNNVGCMTNTPLHWKLGSPSYSCLLDPRARNDPIPGGPNPAHLPGRPAKHPQMTKRGISRHTKSSVNAKVHCRKRKGIY